MSRMFGIGQKESKERDAHDYEQLCAKNHEISEEMAHLQELADVFSEFSGWDAFRKKYLSEIRLTKLYSAAGKALSADDKTRNQLAGQIAEASFLAQALPIIESKLHRLTLRQKEVQGKMMLLDSHKAGSKSQ